MNKVASLRPWQRRIRAAEIRDMAVAQLFYRRDDFDKTRFRDELEAIRNGAGDQVTPDVMEAEIAMILAFEPKPRRAQKTLYRLYKERTARNELAQFERFVAALKLAETQGVSMEGLYVPQAFLSMDHDAIWSDVGSVIDRLKSVVGEVFLNSGTLLGAVRDKALIAHDDDVDLAVILNADNPEEAAADWLSAQAALEAHGLLAERQGPNPGVVKLTSQGAYNIDLFPGWVADGKVFVYPHTSGELAETDLLPLKSDTTSGLPIPADPEAMLAVNYGEGWRAPDPGFEFPWNRANRRFAAFRKALEQ